MSKICYYHLDMNFKRSVIFIGAMLATLQSIAQDAIIFRDGRVKSVKIIQTNNDKTLFKEHTEIPKDAIVVYYKDGREVPAYNLTMDASVVSFKTTKKAKDRPIFSPKSEVFMIRYPDGTRDILSNLAVAEQQQREREAEEARLKAQREAEVADSIKAAAIEEAASATNPKKATIVTKKGVRMKVWVCSDTATMVSYKKVNSAKAAIFNMSKAKIKNIIY